MLTRRAARIAELIREEASQIILYELSDPRIQSVTITRVEVSGDLRYAKIYLSVLGDEAQRRTVFRGLASARGLVQSRISKTLGLREAPSLSFEFDPSIAKSIEISKLLDQVAAERKASQEAPPPEDSAPAPDGEDGQGDGGGEEDDTAGDTEEAGPDDEGDDESPEESGPAEADEEGADDCRGPDDEKAQGEDAVGPDDDKKDAVDDGDWDDMDDDEP